MNIIKKCFLFGPYLLIDSGVLLFIFDTRINYPFDINLLINLDKDLIFKQFFIEYPQRNKKEVRTFNEKLISNIVLDKKTVAGPTHRELINKYFRNILRINYNISQHTNLIAFMSLRGLHNK
jgi:hypothetical protein